jgi:hypothetical protein
MGQPGVGYLPAKLASDAVEVPELPGREQTISSEFLNQRFQGDHATTSQEGSAERW